jgi:hypothetical protein
LYEEEEKSVCAKCKGRKEKKERGERRGENRKGTT